MSQPVLYGSSLSPFVRTVLLTLTEKSAGFEHVDVGFADIHQPPHLARHPFGKIPVFEHDGFMLYETQAIIRFIDQAFDGPRLHPADSRHCGRMNQILGIIDCYATPSITMAISFQRLASERIYGEKPDEAAIEAALPQARLCLQEFERLKAGNRFLAGDEISLADLHLAPVLNYLLLTPEGPSLLAPHTELAGWWKMISARPSLVKTFPNLASNLA
jgi:glutathione S-transferase